MDIDPDISNWILDFLLKQTLEDRSITTLLSTLPLPENNNRNLQKLILLKKLESQVSHNSISETALEFLEQLQGIVGVESVSESMKHAYCSVAVKCTVKHLAVEDSSEKKYEFFTWLSKLWRGRIGRMEKVLGKGGLCSEELCTWRDEIEASVHDDIVCESVVKKSESVNAVEAVSVYVKEEMEKMGPSFLELVAETVKDDDILLEMLGMGGVAGVTGKEALNTCTDRDTLSNENKEVHKEKIQRTRKLPSGNRRGTKIVDPHEMPVRPSFRNYNLPRSAEVNKVREALESSSMELQAVVKDPLPDALRVAETMSGMSKKHEGDYLAKENCTKPSVFIVDGGGVVQDSECNTSIMPRLSLMGRNSTAHTYEWEESVDSSQEDSANRRGRLKLPSPRKVGVSPLDKYKIKNLKERRRKRKWSLLEEDTLRTGVEVYGKGNWKLIQTAYKDIFEDRTDVDLKDKWRNMSRY